MPGSKGGLSNKTSRSASDADNSGASPIRSYTISRMTHSDACHSRAAAIRAWRSVEANFTAPERAPKRNLRFVIAPAASCRRSGHTKAYSSPGCWCLNNTMRRAHASARRDIRRFRSGGTTMTGSGTNVVSIVSGEPEVGRLAFSRRRTPLRLAGCARCGTFSTRGKAPCPPEPVRCTCQCTGNAPRAALGPAASSPHLPPCLPASAD